MLTEDLKLEILIREATKVKTVVDIPRQPLYRHRTVPMKQI